jgi:hypothetical protein
MIPNLSSLRSQFGCLPSKENFAPVLGEEIVRGEESVKKKIENLNNLPEGSPVRVSREFCLDPYMFDNFKRLFDRKNDLEVTGAEENLWAVQLWIDGFWSRDFSLQDMQNFVNNFRTELSVSNLFRIGFLFDQSELYETAAMGFDGVMLHVGDMDVYTMQLFTEVGRELAMHIVWVCGSAEEVYKALETDCPNIALSARFHEQPAKEILKIQELRTLIPSNVRPWYLANSLNEKSSQFAKTQKFAYVCGQA